MYRSLYVPGCIGQLIAILVLEMELVLAVDGLTTVSSGQSANITFAAPLSTSPSILGTDNISTAHSELERNTEIVLPLLEIFLWDKTKLDAEQYQRAYCLDRCNGTDIIFGLRRYCAQVICFPCNCRKPECQIYGTCCPEFDEGLVINSSLSDEADVSTESSKNRLTDAVMTKYTAGLPSAQNSATYDDLVCESAEHGSNSEPFHLSVRSCPPQFADDSIRTRCENDIQANELTLHGFLRVSDNKTGLTYFNKYCVDCNGVPESQSILWDLFVECQHYGKVYKALSHEEFFSLALDRNSSCAVTQRPPATVHTESCQKSWFEEGVDTCNETGLWLDYDADVGRACEKSENKPADRVRSFKKNAIYKNIFCAICNMGTYPRYGLGVCPRARTAIYYRYENIQYFTPMLPFSLLINFDTENSREQFLLGGELDNCSSAQEWLNPDNKCMPLRCSAGKLLVNGNCSTAVKEISGLAYKLRLLYLPRISLNISSYDGELSQNASIKDDGLADEYLHSFQLKMETIFMKYFSEMEVNVNFVPYHQTPSIHFEEMSQEVANTLKRVSQSPSQENNHVQWFSVDGIALAKREYSRDALEDELVKGLLAEDIIITNNENASFALQPLVISEGHDKVLGCDDAGPPCLGRRIALYYGFGSLERWEMQDMLVVSHKLLCPYVSFNQSEYVTENNERALTLARSVNLKFDATQFHFSEVHELNMLSIDEAGTLHVCQELLRTKAEQSAQHGYGKQSTLHRWLYILTLICLSASMLCLVLTLITYFLFKQLRSTAGKNNICLCLSLLLAQTFLIVSSHVTDTGALCTALGICTHFLWLTMFCWCFACCFHMFRVFTAKTRSVRTSPNSETLYLVKRIAFCSAIPAVIIILVIIINLLTSARLRIGYGARACYLDSMILITTTMVVPLAIILLCNFIFFIVTIVKIHNVRKLQTNADFKKSDRENMYIYIKLSSMTGVFWTIQIIAEAFDNDPLRFIAVVLNGLQGVFMFLSYICNKRVLKMYVALMGLEAYVPVSITTDQSTLGRVAAEVNNRDKETEHMCITTKKTSPSSPHHEDIATESHT